MVEGGQSKNGYHPEHNSRPLNKLGGSANHPARASQIRCIRQEAGLLESLGGPKLTGEVQALVVSVGYSLAPAFPLPAALHDGYLIALWVVINARSLSGVAGQIHVPNFDDLSDSHLHSMKA